MLGALFVHRLSQVARAAPGAIAIVRDGQPALTYEQLWGEGTHIAAELVRNGVKRGDFVGLFLSKSPEFVTGLIGT